MNKVKRLEQLERRHSPVEGPGLVLISSPDVQDDDIFSLSWGDDEIERRPGESLDDLLERAHPPKGQCRVVVILPRKINNPSRG